MIKQFPSERIQFDEKSQKPIFELKENEEYEILMDNANNHSENDVKLIEFLSGKKIKIIPTQKGFFISVGSFVGSAEFKKFIIRIIPKFSEITKLPLLIDYAYELKDKDIVEDELRFESDIHFSVEWLIRPLVSRCQKLIKIGLTKSYVDVEDNLHYLRGRLLLAPQINNDAKMRLKFACEYD